MMDGFQAHRGRLIRLAYGMLGSRALAEEVVQDAWIRGSKQRDVRSPGAWWTTVVTRLCLDELKSARARREEYPGPWLPEPIVHETPEDVGLFTERVSMATMVVLESLSGPERAAFLLREAFDVSYQEISGVLDRTPEATRQLVHRARRALTQRRRKHDVDASTHDDLLARFALASASGDVKALSDLLADDCVFVSDGGGRVAAALCVLEGSERVSKFCVGLARKFSEGVVPEFVQVSGLPGVVLRDADGVVGVMAFCLSEGRVQAVYQVRNPDKLEGVTR